MSVGCVEGTWHVGIVQSLAAMAGGVYVEIGVRDGACFNAVAPLVTEAHAVDPVRHPDVTGGTFWEMTSDEFFRAAPDVRADTVFIDGDHSHAQARRDLANALRILRPDGTIVMHDTWPTARDDPDTGGAWRVALRAETNPLLAVVTLRRWPGLTVIQEKRINRGFA